MADKAGANGNTIHADEQPPRSGTERKRKGSGKEKGSVESGTRWKQLLLKHRFKNDHGWRCKRTKGEREDDIGKDEENGEREDGNEHLKEQERFEKLYNLKEKKSWWQVPLVKGSAKVSVTLALSFMEFYWSKLSLLAYCDSRRINEPDKTN